jgi:hypothetical protein
MPVQENKPKQTQVVISPLCTGLHEVGGRRDHGHKRLYRAQNNCRFGIAKVRQQRAPEHMQHRPQSFFMDPQRLNQKCRQLTAVQYNRIVDDKRTSMAGTTISWTARRTAGCR